MIHAGQGVHWADAYEELKELAELLAAPVSTSLEGKSAFDETHPLALGSGGAAISKTRAAFPRHVAASSSASAAASPRPRSASPCPRARSSIHSTISPEDINKSVIAQHALIGDAKLALQAVIAAVRKLVPARSRRLGRRRRDQGGRPRRWMKQWLPDPDLERAPLTPYRVLWDLQRTVDMANTIITHDAGCPRDQLTPFWKTKAPMTYIGWGQDHPAGPRPGPGHGRQAGLPRLALHQCLGRRGDRLHRHGLRDRRARAAPDPVDPAQQRLDGHRARHHAGRPPSGSARPTFRATTLRWPAPSAAMASASSESEDIMPAIKRGIEKTSRACRVLLEFITSKK